ncbi:MAG TPA: MerR family transcriptional regulator [Patescibacteria group bacterium]|nr:MerR family transcriptional regulator [Patescibacteria group bacterium]
MNQGGGDLTKKIVTLKQASDTLGVSISTLLTWNEYNILKPTITQSGEVVYFQEQIDRFLTIRKLSQNAVAQSVQSMSPKIEQITTQSVQAPLPSPVSNSIIDAMFPPAQVSHVEKQELHDYAPRIDSSSKKTGLSQKANVALGISAVGIILVGAFITSGSGWKALLDKSVLTSQRVLYSQTSKFALSGPNNFAHPIDLKSKNESKNLNNEGEASPDDKLLAANGYFANRQANENALKKAGSKVSQGSKMSNSDIQTASAGSSDYATYGEVSNFASNCPTCSSDSETQSNGVFDERGNIKGKTGNADLLASILQGTGSMQGSSLTRQAAPNNFVIWITVGLLSLVFVFGKQPPYSLRRSYVSQVEAISHTHTPDDEKVLEVDQKTDGTVVINFLGREIKVSKPELDSESDQFIERLMNLVTTDDKEIDYDNSRDDEVGLSAPLSKLVTRLGFVGVKRDLFFPRTSKNRILFRKYVTRGDLASMNLTTEQISKEIFAISQS